MAVAEAQFLSNFPRAVRKPITLLSQECIQGLRYVHNLPQMSELSLITLINKASLVFSAVGRSDVADRICRAELDWIADRSHHAGRAAPHIQKLCLNPYINRGRLLVAAQAYDEASSHFEQIRLMLSGGDACFGPCGMPAALWSDIDQQNGGLGESVSNAYLIEMLRQYHGQHRYSNGLDICGKAPRASPLLREEGRMMCLSKLDLRCAIQELVTDACKSGDIYHQAVLFLHNESIHTQENTSRLAIATIHGAFGEINKTVRLRFLHKQCHTLQKHQGSGELLHILAKQGLETARSIQDEPFEQAFLALAVPIDTDEYRQDRHNTRTGDHDEPLHSHLLKLIETCLHPFFC